MLGRTGAAADAESAGRMRRRGSTASTVCLSDSSTSSCSPPPVTVSTRCDPTGNSEGSRPNSRDSGSIGSSIRISCSSGDSSSGGGGRETRAGGKSSSGSSSGGDDTCSNSGSCSRGKKLGRGGRSSGNSGNGACSGSQSSGGGVFPSRRKGSSNTSRSSQSSSDGTNSSSEVTITTVAARGGTRSNRHLPSGHLRREGASIERKGRPSRRACDEQPGRTGPSAAAAAQRRRQAAAPGVVQDKAETGPHTLAAAAGGRISRGRSSRAAVTPAAAAAEPRANVEAAAHTSAAGATAAAASTGKGRRAATLQAARGAADAAAVDFTLVEATAAAAARIEAEVTREDEAWEKEEGSDVEIVAVAVPANRWAAYLRQQQQQWEALESEKTLPHRDASLPASLYPKDESGPRKTVAPTAEEISAEEAAEAAAVELTAAAAAPEAREAEARGGTAATLQQEPKEAAAAAPPSPAVRGPHTAASTAPVTTKAAAAAEGSSTTVPRRGWLAPQREGAASTTEKHVNPRPSNDSAAAAAGRKPPVRDEDGAAASSRYKSPLLGAPVGGSSAAGEQHMARSREPTRGTETDCSERVLHALLVLAAKYDQQGEARRAHGFRVAAATFRRLCFGSNSSEAAGLSREDDKASLPSRSPHSSSSSGCRGFRGDSNSNSGRGFGGDSSSSEEAAAVLQREGLTRENYRLLEKQPGIGRKIFQTIEELVTTGSSSRMHALSFGCRAAALEQLQRVWGVGFYTAEKLLARGLHSVAEVRQRLQQLEQAGQYEEARSLLSRPQRLGLKYVEAFEQRIPRAEVAAVALYLRQLLLRPPPPLHAVLQHEAAAAAETAKGEAAAVSGEGKQQQQGQPGPPATSSGAVLQLQQQLLHREAQQQDALCMGPPAGVIEEQRRHLFGQLLQKRDNPFVDLFVCGSYRRGKADCGDIDILLLRREGSPHRLLHKVVKGLTAAGLLVDHLLTCDSTHAADAAEEGESGGGDAEGEGDNDSLFFPMRAAKRRREDSSSAARADEDAAAEEDSFAHGSARRRAGVELYCGACVWPPRLPVGSVAPGDVASTARAANEEGALFWKGERGMTLSDSYSAFVGPLLPRRIDIKIYPARCAAFALLYFTGSAEYNRAMRLWAKRCGYSLDDTGIYPVVPFPMRRDHDSTCGDTPVSAAGAPAAAADPAAHDSATVSPAADEREWRSPAGAAASRRRTGQSSIKSDSISLRSSSYGGASGAPSDSLRHVDTSQSSSSRGNESSEIGKCATVAPPTTGSEAHRTSDARVGGSGPEEGSLIHHVNPLGSRRSPPLPLDHTVYRRLGSSLDRKKRKKGGNVAPVLWKDLQNGVHCDTEEDIFRTLGVAYVPPSEREVFVEP